MAWLPPTNTPDPVTGLPQGAVILEQYMPSRPPVISQTFLAAPSFDQLANPSAGHTI